MEQQLANGLGDGQITQFVKKAKEKDRALVLAALFRSSSDCIVKDDGTPDIGIAALASKVVSR